MDAEPILIGIAGGSGSGKTHLAREVQVSAGHQAVSILSMDQYFRGLSPSEEDSKQVNFDHPALLDLDQMLEDVAKLKQGQTIRAPSYDFLTEQSQPRSIEVRPTPILIIEGLFVLSDPMHHLLDLSCYLEVASDQRLLGRILRDVKERGSTIEEIVDRYQRFVRPAYEVFVAPTKHNADVVVDFTYRRAFFTDMLAELCRQFVDGNLELSSFTERVRRDAMPLGYRPEEGMMPISVDLRVLANAYPPASPTHPFSRTSDPEFELKIKS